MKAIFSKNRVTFQPGNGMTILVPSKLSDMFQEELKSYTINILLPIYYGNERQHSGLFAAM